MKACHSANSIIILAFVAVALVAALSTVATAEAHALLIRSDPPANALLREPPDTVTAWFSEPLEPSVSRLRVLGGTGQQLDAGKMQFNSADPTMMAVALREDISPGFYLVAWETLSRVDGHFRFGSFEFTVLNPDGSQPSGPRPVAAFAVTGAPTGIAEGGTTKAIGLIGAAILVGGVASLLFVILPAGLLASEASRLKLRDASGRFVLWVLLPAALLLLVAGLAELWLQVRQFGGLAELDRVIETEWGERWLWRHYTLASGAAFLVLYLGLRTRSAAGASLWAALAAGLAYLLLVSLVSHANAIPQGSFWATASDFVHLSTAAIWIGGLVSLTGLLIWSARSVDPAARPLILAGALRRFSLVAATCLALLLATGIFSALVQVSTWSALVETAYGRALAIKLGLILPLLAVAALNALVLRPRLVGQALGDAGSVERLRRLLARTVPLEAALAFAVLAVVGVLTQYTPARVETPAAEPPPAALASLEGRGAFDFPLVTGDWSWVAAVGLVVAGVLVWIWAQGVQQAPAALGRPARVGALSLAAAAAVIAAISLATPPGDPAFPAAIALRYEATDGRQVLLQIDPFQVGANTFRVAVLTEEGEALEAESVALRFSRLEVDDPPAEVTTTPGGGGEPAFFASFELPETGWWMVEAVLDGNATAAFHLRLDRPSLAPLEFAPPNYESDAAAEALFRQALERYEGLASVRWREEVTSGLLAPTGIGAWVIATGQAEAPDKISYRVLSPGASDYRLVRAGAKSCFQDKGGPWECSESPADESFDLDYLEPSTAFKFGRMEIVDGEMAQVLLFYNPSQGAWYAWWIGEQTGLLHTQAMVAPGHFMLTHFSGHNQPVIIPLPEEAASPGG